MYIASFVFQIILCLAVIFLVLIHSGRGGGLSDMFGGGLGASAAGSTVMEKNLDRLTLFVGAIWLISIVGTGLLVKIEG